MRRLTVKDGGPSFEEELLEWDAWDRKLRYRIVGENPLPVTDYQSTIEVLKTGRNEATVVTDASLDHWRAVLCNPFRRRWARGYLDWIGAERLALMGYDAAELRAQLEAAPVSAKRLLSDLPRAAYGVLDRVLELDVLRRKWSTAGGASIGRHA